MVTVPRQTGNIEKDKEQAVIKSSVLGRHSNEVIPLQVDDLISNLRCAVNARTVNSRRLDKLSSYGTRF